MKWLLAALFLIGASVVVFGPLWGERDVRPEVRFAGAVPTLPMTFTHQSHVSVVCSTCHHEFLDGTSGASCIACHATDPKVAPLLETQFHTLCRTCHIDKQVAGLKGGPTRDCVDCHTPDTEF